MWGVTLNHKQAKQGAENLIKNDHLAGLQNLAACYLDLLDAVKGLMEYAMENHAEDCIMWDTCGTSCDCGCPEAWDRVQKIIGGEK
jgi:hypothetical protein